MTDRVWIVLLKDPADALVYEYSEEGLERAKRVTGLAKDRNRLAYEQPVMRLVLSNNDMLLEEA